jgi:hypothetical protein
LVYGITSRRLWLLVRTGTLVLLYDIDTSHCLGRTFSVYPKYPTCSSDQQLGKVAGSGGVTRQVLAHQPLLPGRLYILYTFVLAKYQLHGLYLKLKVQ